MPKQTFTAEELRYLKLLAREYPTVQAASTEIINLQAILNLPKGTEHFISDIHGEYEAFLHILNSCSGVIKEKIDDVFASSMPKTERDQLATLIYYPQEKLELIARREPDPDEWYRITLHRLIEVCRLVSSKYTRSKVRKALPKEYAYIIDELLNTNYEVHDKKDYYENIINTIIDIDRAEDFIEAVCGVIKRMVVDQLHVVGDLFDRGPRADIILDALMEHPNVDIQWGNHDVLWMGAATGSRTAVATVLANSIHYNNLEVIETGYGISLRPLSIFANEVYKDCDTHRFAVKLTGPDAEQYTEKDKLLAARMHKAITVMQLKLENRLIRENPEYGMENRRLLEKIDYQNGTVTIGEKTYALRDKSFPTIDPAHPDELTEKEAEVLDKLIFAFRNSEKLQAHVDFLLKKGSLYRVYNGNLLYHGCMPMNEDGTLKEVQVDGKKYKGKALYDILEHNVRRAFVSRDPKKREQGRNTLWYLWTAPNSPLYGRDKMTTFERYFLAEKETWTEVKNAYYRLIEKEETADRILQEFGLAGENVHIINGHVPVHQSAGESPVKCGGKVLIIDGGFCRAYHKETGIAGYTLIYNSYGLSLTAHEPFESTEKAIQEEKDIVSRQVAVRYNMKRQLVGDTDQGRQIRQRIRELKELIEAYRTAQLKELL